VLDKLTCADFAPHVGEAFRIVAPSGEVVGTELTEATALRAADPPPPRRRGFSLVFLGPQGSRLPQGTYRVENDRMGSMELFLVPIGAREGRVCYEAVFN
jgi:Domain of unknown function (DUF6916)